MSIDGLSGDTSMKIDTMWVDINRGDTSMYVDAMFIDVLNVKKFTNIERMF